MNAETVVLGARDVARFLTIRECIDGIARTLRAHEAGKSRGHHAITTNVMTEHDVHGEFSAIVAGRVPGRTTREQVFVFDSTGTALQDVAAAVLVYQRAAVAGAGLRVLMDDRHVATSVEAP